MFVLKDNAIVVYPKKALYSGNMMADEPTGYIYVLLLETAKYYVGWSAQVDVRIAQHFLGTGSKWTQMHKPVQVILCTPGDKLMENLTTIALMCRHGFRNVRGGSWCQLDMQNPPKAILTVLRYHPDKREQVYGNDGEEMKDLHSFCRDEYSSEMISTTYYC